jgi:transcriptional regulator with XRE-family HTH domain
LPKREHRDAGLLTLGRAIRQMREQMGMSADELSDATGMTPRRLAALETGRLDPTYDLLLVVVEGLGVRLSALMALAEQLEQSSEP